MLHSNLQARRSRFVRRAALAALLASTVWQSTSQAESPSSIKLELLPPLPVQVGQLDATASSLILKRGPSENPFCQVPAAGITLVSGENQTGPLQPTTDLLLLQPVSEQLAAEQAATGAVEAADTVELIKPKSTLRLAPMPASPPLATPAESPVAGVVVNEFVNNEPTPEAITFQMSDQETVYSLGDLESTEPTSGEQESVEQTAAELTSPRRRRAGLPVPVTLDELPADGEGQIAAGAPPWLIQAARQDGQVRANPMAVPVVKASPPNVASRAVDDLPVPRLPIKIAEPPTVTNRSTVGPLVTNARLTPANALDSSPIVVATGPNVDPSAELVSRSQGLIIDVPVDDDPGLKKPTASTATVPPGSALDSGTVAATAEPIQAVSAFDQVTTLVDNIDVAKAHMRPLQLPEMIHRFHVEDDTICRVVAVGPRELRVIGQQPGSSRLAVWTGSDETTEPQFYNIRVEHRPQSELQSLQQTAEELTKSLLATFPHSRVRVVAADKRLVIQGVAVNDDQARSMLQLVRQTCLVPVVDQLSTR